MWQEEFELLELSEVMRQTDDHSFIDLLGRVSIAQCTLEDIDILESRVITCDSDSSSYPINALHVYRLNADVDKHNSEMLNRLTSEKEQVVIESSDSMTRHFNLSNLSTKRSETGGLHGTLRLAIGVRVMLTANVDVSDGLVNGARGEVVHFIRKPNGGVITILVKFDITT